MIKRYLSVMMLALALSAVAGAATLKDGPSPDPSCYPSGCCLATK
jgi:hypothetical protein